MLDIECCRLILDFADVVNNFVAQIEANPEWRVSFSEDRSLFLPLDSRPIYRCDAMLVFISFCNLPLHTARIAE